MKQKTKDTLFFIGISIVRLGLLFVGIFSIIANDRYWLGALFVVLYILATIWEKVRLEE